MMRSSTMPASSSCDGTTARADAMERGPLRKANGLVKAGSHKVMRWAWRSSSAGAVAFLVACSTPDTTAPAAPSAASAASTPEAVAALLGLGFGQLMVVEAEVLVHDPHKGSREHLLRVLQIDGRPAHPDLLIPWTYGGWFAHVPEPAGHGGFTVEVGRIYRLRGYETGSWIGSPEGLLDIPGDEFWPPQSKGFHFLSTFRILDGELVR